MSENETRPKLTVPEQPEQPEEGFVPYAAEAASEEQDRKKHRRKILIPVLLLVLIAVITGILLLLTRLNRYHSVMKKLEFDYRKAEIPGSSEGVTPGEHSIRLAEQLKQQPVEVKAVSYRMDENGKVDSTVSEYEYLSSMGLTELKTVYSASSSIRSKKKDVRLKSDGYEKLVDDDWKPAENEYIPPLRDYFFGITSHDNIAIGCYDSYPTSVGDRSYSCEVWLMDEHFGDTVQYDTVYRYYDGDRLAGVIILRDSEEWKEVFDIRSYNIYFGF